MVGGGAPPGLWKPAPQLLTPGKAPELGPMPSHLGPRLVKTPPCGSTVLGSSILPGAWPRGMWRELWAFHLLSQHALVSSLDRGHLCLPQPTLTTAMGLPRPLCPGKVSSLL